MKKNIISVIILFLLFYSCSERSMDPDLTSNFNPAFIYNSNQDSVWDVFAMNNDGSEQVNLTNGIRNSLFPQYFPLSLKIIFQQETSYNRRYSKHEIFIMNLNGSNQIKITDDSSDNSHCQFSPDGQKFFFDLTEPA